jgi:hypothetical protein
MAFRVVEGVYIKHFDLSAHLVTGINRKRNVE